MHDETQQTAAGEPGTDFFEQMWERSMTYIKTVVDVAREPMLILDTDFRVIAANECFYDTFKVVAKDTEKEPLHELGNGQWDIPILQKLLHDVLQQRTYFKGFQVAHEFPKIGRKVIILNARQIHILDSAEAVQGCPPIILLAMEDVTDLMVVGESLAKHANEIESKLSDRAERLEIHIKKLEKEIEEIKEK